VTLSSPKPNKGNHNIAELANAQGTEVIRSNPIGTCWVFVVPRNPLKGSQIKKPSPIPTQGEQKEIARKADGNKPAYMQPRGMLPRTYCGCRLAQIHIPPAS